MKLSESVYGTINVDRIYNLPCDTFSHSNDNNNIKKVPSEGWGKIVKNYSDFNTNFLTLNTMLLLQIFYSYYSNASIIISGHCQVFNIFKKCEEKAFTSF